MKKTDKISAHTPVPHDVDQRHERERRQQIEDAEPEGRTEQVEERRCEGVDDRMQTVHGQTPTLMAMAATIGRGAEGSVKCGATSDGPAFRVCAAGLAPGLPAGGRATGRWRARAPTTRWRRWRSRRYRP